LIQVDLDLSYAVSRVRLVWGTAYAPVYQTQVTSDGVTSTTVRSSTAGDECEGDNFGLTATCRHVRIFGTTRATAWGDSLFTFEVYGR
jgi:hypothetical protein